MKRTIKLTALFLLIFSFCFGQMDDYNYQRELSGIKDTWHSIPIPNDLFKHLESGSHDLRIYGINSDQDTLEAPYLLDIGKEINIIQEKNFKLLNTSKNDKGHYFTYEIVSGDPINQMQLNFTETNFDWKIKLEGTQNQKEWFTILDDYRILSIQNNETNYQFTKISFPESQYRYFRILVKTQEKVSHKSAAIQLTDLKAGKFRDCPIQKMDFIVNKEKKQTAIHLKLAHKAPIHQLNIDVADDYDYYRNIVIKSLTDSTETEKGIKYHYKNIYSGTLHSISDNQFVFPSTLSKQYKIIIHNRDNEPLNISDVSVKGYHYELIARFNQPANYSLFYGKEFDRRPSYDIEQFRDKIPESLSSLQIGKEKNRSKEEVKKTAALFENPLWLWGIMILIILILGGFTLSMMKKI